MLACEAMRTHARSGVDPVAAAGAAFTRISTSPAEGVAFAPGRVNLIGEHTDYNDGFVLPMAMQEGVAAAFGPSGDRVLRVYASDIGDTREVQLDSLERNQSAVRGWFRYAAGVAWAMLSAGVPLQGTNVAIAANLPSGSGLSSSAAFELAIARALAAVARITWDPRAAAVMAQRAEHEFARVACGIMDQMAVACATDGHALLIDCRSLETRHVTLPSHARVVVMNSGVRRSLATSAYNDRRAACERAVAAMQEFDPSVRALRDVDRQLLERARSRMDDVAFTRALHVVDESRRPEAFAAALETGDLASAGQLMIASHESLRDLYEVSCRELDLLVALSTAQPGCYGARLTGAGFGGCAIALVDADRVDAFSMTIADGYAARIGRRPDVIVSRPSAGARVVT
jgi:galactokinase